MNRFGLTARKAAQRIEKFGVEVEKATRKQRILKLRRKIDRDQIKRNERFPTSREIRMGELVVIDENGMARTARRGEAPIGMVIGNSQQTSSGKSSFSVTIRPDSQHMLR